MYPYCHICWTAFSIDQTVLKLPDFNFTAGKLKKFHQGCADFWILNVPAFKTQVSRDVYVIWYSAVSQHVKDVMDKREIHRIVSQQPSSFVCTTPDCPFLCTFANKCGAYSRFRCPQCKVLQRIEQPIKVSSQDALQYKTGFRQCPTCNTVIEKSDGCPYMACAVCGTPFTFNTTVNKTDMSKDDKNAVSELFGLNQ